MLAVVLAVASALVAAAVVLSLLSWLAVGPLKQGMLKLWKTQKAIAAELDGMVSERVAAAAQATGLGAQADERLERLVEARLGEAVDARLDAAVDRTIDAVLERHLPAVLEDTVLGLFEERVRGVIEGRVPHEVDARIDAAVDRTLDAVLDRKLEALVERRLAGDVAERIGTVLARGATDAMVEETAEARAGRTPEIGPEQGA